MMSTNTHRTHPLNIGYLVVGLVFLGLSASWLLNETGVIEPDGFHWLLPAILLGAGLVGLFASLGKGVARRRSRPEFEPPAFTQDTHDTQPILDLTSDLDRKLDEHRTTTQSQPPTQTQNDNDTGEPR
jgi:hypothetical protein